MLSNKMIDDAAKKLVKRSLELSVKMQKCIDEMKVCEVLEEYKELHKTLMQDQFEQQAIIDRLKASGIQIKQRCNNV